MLDLDDLVTAVRRRCSRTTRPRPRPALADPAPLRRRVPGRQPGPVAPARGVARARARPLRGGRPPPGHLRLERRRPHAARPASRARPRDRPSCASTTTTAPPPRSWRAAARRARRRRPARRRAPTARAPWSTGSTTTTTRPRRWPGGCGSAHRPGRPWSHLAVLARTNARLDPVARALERPGSRSGSAAAPRSPPTPASALAELRRAPKTRHLRSALADLVVARQARPRRRRRGDAGPEPDRGLRRPWPGSPTSTPSSSRRHRGRVPDWVVAGGDARRWSATPVTASSCRPSTGPRASSGRRWPSSVSRTAWCPSPTPRRADAVAEERRLLYVAPTRAEDELWCSWARTRAGPETGRGDATPRPLLGAVARPSRRRRRRHRRGGDCRPRIASLRTMLPAPADRAG